MGEVIEVSRQNRAELAKAHDAIRRNHLRLVKATRRYPLFIEFAGYRFVLDRPAEIYDLVATLGGKLRAHAASR